MLILIKIIIKFLGIQRVLGQQSKLAPTLIGLSYKINLYTDLDPLI